MSHSTEITIEIGLDKHELYCGSRLPATAFQIGADQSKTFTDDDALCVLGALPNVGAGRRGLLGALYELAVDEKNMRLDGASVPREASGWLKVEIQHCT